LNLRWWWAPAVLRQRVRRLGGVHAAVAARLRRRDHGCAEKQVKATPEAPPEVLEECS
jgi:hypothetical protein